MSQQRCRLVDANICDANINRMMDVDSFEIDRRLASADRCRYCGVRRNDRWRNTFGLLRPNDAPAYRSVVVDILPVQPLVSIIVDYVTVVVFEAGDVVDAIDQRRLFCSAVVLYVWTASIRIGLAVRPIRLHLVKYIGWPDRYDTAVNDAGMRLYSGRYGRNQTTFDDDRLSLAMADTDTEKSIRLFEATTAFYDQMSIDLAAADFRIAGRSADDCLPLMTWQAADRRSTNDSAS